MLLQTNQIKYNVNHQKSLTIHLGTFPRTWFFLWWYQYNYLSQTNNWLIDKTISICNWLTTGNSWNLLFANETIFQHNRTNAVKWLNWDRYNANSNHHWRLNHYVEWILIKMDRNGKCNYTTSDINLRQHKSDWTVQNEYNNAV